MFAALDVSEDVHIHYLFPRNVAYSLKPFLASLKSVFSESEIELDALFVDLFAKPSNFNTILRLNTIYRYFHSEGRPREKREYHSIPKVLALTSNMFYVV